MELAIVSVDSHYRCMRVCIFGNVVCFPKLYTLTETSAISTSSRGSRFMVSSEENAVSIVLPVVYFVWIATGKLCQLYLCYFT